MRTRTAAASAALLLFALGCSGTDNPAPLTECQGPVTVSVGSGDTPDISWTPRCTAAQVYVGQSSGFLNYWFDGSADSSNSIQPPAHYGHPPGELGTFPLPEGGTYVAHVVRATGDSTAPFEEIGSLQFSR